MLAADRSGAPLVQADILRLPVPDGAVDGVTCGFALRNLVDLGGVLRRAGAASCGRAGGSPCSTSPRRPTRSCGGATASTSARSCPCIGGLLSDPARLPVPAPQRGLPPAAGRDAGPAARGRVRRRVAAATAVGWHHPARHGDADDDACRAVTRPLEPRRRPQRRRRRRRLPVRARRRRPGRPRRGGAGAARRRAGRAGRRSSTTTRSGSPAAGRWPSARCPSGPARRAELVVPARRRRQGRRRHRVDHHDRRRRRARSTASTSSPPPPAPQRAFSVEPGVDRSRLPRRRRGRRATRSGPAGSTKVVIARRRARSTADRPLDVHAVLSGCGPAFGSQLPLLGRRASSAPRPSCWWPATATSCAPTPSPARRPATATRPTTPASPPRCIASHEGPGRAPGRRSTMVHDTLLPWCSYLDWEAEPSIVAVANVQHLGTLVEGRLSSPAPNVLELVAGAVADAGPRRPPARRGARAHRRGRGLRPRPLRRRGGMGRRGRQRDVGGRHPLRRDRRRHGPPLRRRRHRGRQRSAGRAGRDAGQAAGHALGHHPA